MCFSAAASFTASAVLGATGIAAIIRTKEKKMLPLATLPLVFAIQQAVEGGLWLSIGGTGKDTLLLSSLFLFFALFWWPAFVPFAVRSIEPFGWRRKVLTAACLVGTALGIYLYANFLLNPTPASVVNQCIYYNYSAPYSMVAAIIYILVTVGAGVMSSRYMVKVVFSVMAVSAFIASWLYYENFTSVWCFFAAIVSVLIYLIVTGKEIQKKERKVKS